MRRRSRRLRDLPLGGPARSYAAEIRDNGDGTFDLVGVEILSVGGPIHGIGSPPEGDFWTLEELRGMAEADAELGDELLPPNKIGHPDEQTLVRNSIDAGEIPTPRDGELPAAGWLEDLRVEGTKLLADVRRVPRVVCELIEKGAYRTRSVELAKVTSQTTGKTYDWVVTGLAWLGGKMPAVRTLGDVVALYQGDVETVRRAVLFEERELAAGDVAWNPDDGLESLRAKVNEALNPGPAAMDAPVRYWVRDVAPGKALVEDWTAEPGAAWVVPFQTSGGTVTVAPSSDWIAAEQAWVEVGRANEERALTLREGRPDTRAKMRYTAEQRRKFAEATGLEATAVTDEMLAAAGVTPEEPEAPETKPETVDRSLEERVQAAEQRAATAEAKATGTAEELRLERRRNFVADAIRSRKFAPGQHESLETLFDKLGEDAARKFVDDQPVRDDLDELGDDGDADAARELEEAAERSYAEDAAARLGIPKERIV